jgi:hypothetical protein
MDLSTIPDSVLLARGKYSTIRAEHEDAKKQLQVHCGQLGSVAAQVLRAMQPDNDAEPESVADLLAAGHNTLNAMETIALQIQALATQRAELKPIAWPRGAK